MLHGLKTLEGNGQTEMNEILHVLVNSTIFMGIWVLKKCQMFNVYEYNTHKITCTYLVYYIKIEDFQNLWRLHKCAETRTVIMTE